MCIRDSAHRDVLAAGSNISGCTVHFVDEGVDTGPILGQSRVDVHPDDNIKSLQDRVKIEEHKLYPKILDEINKNFNNNNFNAVLSLLIIFIIIKSIPPVLSWTVIDANISGNSKEACTGEGACWTYIKVWLRRFIYGLYPNEEQWRINLSFISLLALGSVGYFATEKFKKYLTLYYVVIYPIIAFLFILWNYCKCHCNHYWIFCTK